MLGFNYKGGGGILNSLINKLPFELHIPNYNYCGPGTKLNQRLNRGDPPINKLDAACKEHDIFYLKNKSLEKRHQADWGLENRAWERVNSKDAKLKEKAAAWLVTTGMKVKRKLGMGCKSTHPKPARRRIAKGRRRSKKRGGGIQKKKQFKRDIIDEINKSLKNKQMDISNSNAIKKSSLTALQAAKVAVKKAGGAKNIRVPRIIPFQPKSGGILPLLPLLGALGALGSVAGGASAIARTVIDAKNAKKKLMEQKRHNKFIEEEIGKRGSGLFLRKNKKGGYGLYLKKKTLTNYQ